MKNIINKQEAQPSQQLIEIKEIKDNIIYLKNDSICKIIMVNGINFELKSEGEQDLILENFKNLLNSLDFPIQILIHSRKTNIENYINFLEKRKLEEENELLKYQIEDYINFIKDFVEKNSIISKNFFIVVRYDPTITEKSSFNLLSIFKNKPEQDDLNEQQKIEQLEQRVITIKEGLAQLGLNYIELDTESLLELMYNIYNPEITDKKIKQ